MFTKIKDWICKNIQKVLTLAVIVVIMAIALTLCSCQGLIPLNGSEQTVTIGENQVVEVC